MKERPTRRTRESILQCYIVIHGGNPLAGSCYVKKFQIRARLGCCRLNERSVAIMQVGRSFTS